MKQFPWTSVPKYLLIVIVGTYSMLGAYSCGKARGAEPSYRSVEQRVTS